MSDTDVTTDVVEDATKVAPEDTIAVPAPVEEPKKPANLWDDPEAAKAEIERLRKENGAERVNAKAKAAEEARQELAKALGLVEDESPVDPAKLTEELNTERSVAKQARVELAVYKAAGVAGGDPAALLDSRSFLESLHDVDPSDAAAVTAAIEAAVSTNSRLGVSAGPRVPAPNPAQGSSAGGAPSVSDQIADAEKRGDFKTSSALKAAQLAELAQKQVQR